MLAVIWLFILWCLCAQHRAVVDAEVRLELSTGVGEPRLLVRDHGFVRHNQIDDYYPDEPRDIVLVATTSFNDCCSRNFTTGQKEIGWWFFPNGTEIPKIQNGSLIRSFWTSRYKKEIFLYRRRGGTSGIHRCDIPVSADINETRYVGLYPSGDSANPRVTSMQLSLASEHTGSETIAMPEFNVTCKSEGGPATMVTWTRDGKTLDLSGGTFTATRRLDDPVTAAYTLTLSVSGRQGGVYRCQVAKGGPGVTGSPVHSCMELEVKAADPPTGLTAVKEGETTVNVSWTPPICDDTVTGYKIFYQRSNSVTVNASVTQYAIINLEPNITYPITMMALSEHLPSAVVGPVIPRNITETHDGESTWRFIVGGVIGGAGIIIVASVTIAILLYLLQASKTKTSDTLQRDNRWSTEMTDCAAYEGVQTDSQQPEHVYELPLPARQHSADNIASMKSNICGQDGTLQSMHKSVSCEIN